MLILVAATALAIAGLMGGTAVPSRAATQEPCDIYAAADTPCVAAHNTTRTLYAAYDGPLYQVERYSDDTTTDVYPVSAGGVAVQANIVAADYTAYTLPSNPFTSGADVSLQATTPCCTGDYLTGDTSGDDVGIEAVTSSSSTTVKEDATWIVEPGLANSSCVSFQSANGSGDYIRHYDYLGYVASDGGSNAWDASSLWDEDSTWLNVSPWS